MNRMRVLTIVSGVLLMGGLLFGGLTHALVAHEHGDHHGAHDGGSVIWQSLHASLRHEDKKALPFFYLLSIVGIVGLVTYSFVPRRRTHIVDSALDALRRGILPHRMFG